MKLRQARYNNQMVHIYKWSDKAQALPVIGLPKIRAPRHRTDLVPACHPRHFETKSQVRNQNANRGGNISITRKNIEKIIRQAKPLCYSFHQDRIEEVRSASICPWGIIYSVNIIIAAAGVDGSLPQNLSGDNQLCVSVGTISHFSCMKERSNAKRPWLVSGHKWYNSAAPPRKAVELAIYPTTTGRR